MHAKVSELILNINNPRLYTNETQLIKWFYNYDTN